MRGWVARHAVGCFYICLYVVLLCVAEQYLISRFMIPTAPTRTDWIIVAGLMAPLAALAAVLAVMAIGWTVCLAVPRRTRKKEET